MSRLAFNDRSNEVTKNRVWVRVMVSVQPHFQQYFSFIIAVSFISGGNRSTWRKPPTCRKSNKLLSHNTVHLSMSRIQTHNFSGDRHWLHSCHMTVPQVWTMVITEDLTVIVKGMNYGHYWRPDCDCEGYELWSLLKTWLWLWRVWTMVIIEDLTVIVKGMNYDHYWRPDFDCEGYELWSLLKTWLWL